MGKKKKNRILTDAAVQGGIDREEFFKNGGTLAQWRGLHQVHKSRAEKRKSRSSKKKRAIEDSKE